MRFYKVDPFFYIKFLCSISMIVAADTSSDGEKRNVEIKNPNILQSPTFPYLSDHVEDDGHIVETACRAYMKAYGVASSKLVECLISHARPLTMCENCKPQYDAANILYQNITGVLGDEYINCHDSLLRSDIIHVVGQTHDFVERIWKESSCQNCFNGTGSNLAESFSHFQKLYNKTEKCLNKYISSHNLPVKVLSRVNYRRNKGNTTYNITACDECGEPYNELNIFYDELEETYQKAVCMDIVDTMNYTRYTWSVDFHCTVQKKDIASVISLAGFFCLLPVAFYIGTKLHGTRQQKQILKQKRMQRRGSCNYGAAATILAEENQETPPVLPTEQEVMLDEEDEINDEENESETEEILGAHGGHDLIGNEENRKDSQSGIMKQL